MGIPNMTPSKLLRVLTKATSHCDGAERRRGATYGIGIPAELHVTQLLPRPVGVELCGAHEREVHAQAAVHRRAVQADEHSVRHRRPRRVLRVAVETYLRQTDYVKTITYKI